MVLVGSDGDTSLFWVVVPAIRSRFKVGANSRERLRRYTCNAALVVGLCRPTVHATQITYLAKWERDVVRMRLWNAAHLRDDV